MTRSKLIFPVLAALALGIGGLAGTTASSAQAAGRTLCGYHIASVSSGIYTVQNNEWGSSAPECVTTDGGADFAVANSAIQQPKGSHPGGYPSIFMGCHWGVCTKGGLAANPQLILTSTIPGTVTSSWSTTTPSGAANTYDVAYDLWINPTPTTPGEPDGSEIMIWLKSQGGVQPSGSIVAHDVWMGGHEYNVWYSKGGPSDVITYQMASQSTSVSNLDLGSLILDAERRGYTNPLWYLISVEAGFEIWRGGAGLATTNYSVSLDSTRGLWPRLSSTAPAGPVAQPYRP